MGKAGADELGVVGLGEHPRAGIHVPHFVRNARRARNLAKPLPIGTLLDRAPRLSFDDGPGTLVERDALKKRMEDPTRRARRSLPRRIIFDSDVRARQRQPWEQCSPRVK